jgi:hypothetical protein
MPINSQKLKDKIAELRECGIAHANATEILQWVLDCVEEPEKRCTCTGPYGIYVWPCPVHSPEPVTKCNEEDEATIRRQTNCPVSHQNITYCQQCGWGSKTQEVEADEEDALTAANRKC